MKYVDKIQHLLPLGYLYLVALGIIKETAFFYQLDINILNYSSIMDVLISPIATLFSHPIVFVTIVLVFVLSYHLPVILYKHGHKKWVQRTLELKKTKDDLPDAEIKDYYLLVSIKNLAFFLLSIYLGFGFAKGFITSNKIKNDKLRFDHRLSYNTGESENISLLESNSVYYFYVPKGGKSIKIAPIGSVKNIEFLKSSRDSKHSQIEKGG